MPAGVPVLATTATANSRVVADVAEQLDAGGDGVLTIRGPLARASLRLGVLRLPDARTRLAWLLSHLGDLPGSGIIYTLTVAAAQDTARLLREAGHDVRAYTGQTDPADREAAEAALKANEVKALVATSALGMGFDKPDLGFVLHLGAPSSPVAYYQQVGRAGRATDSADVLLLPGTEDPRHLAVLRHGLDAEPGPGGARDRGAVGPADCRRPRSRRGSTSAAPRWSCCSRCSTWTAPCAACRAAGWPPGSRGPTTPSATHASPRPARPSRSTCSSTSAPTAAGWSSCSAASTTRRRPRAGAATRARAPGTRGTSPRARRPRRSARSTASACPSSRARSGRSAPTGSACPCAAASPSRERAVEGRALARLTDLGWGTALREIFAAGALDAPVTRAMLDGCVRVLAQWGWDERPAAVVALPSRRRPLLVDSLARGIAEIGRLPYAGALALRDGGPSGRAGRQQRVPAGGRLGAVRRVRASRSRPGRCCSSTTWWTAGGP